jgi:hypothetical protein
MTMCYPADTDWTCAYTVAELEAMRGNPETLAVMHRSEALAWYTLASLTAYQIGVCPDTVRPCAARCAGLGTWMEAVVDTTSTGGLPVRTIGGIFTPYLSGGNWYNGCGCRRADDCSCSRVSEVILPGPVGSIESVKIDGVEQPRATYRVDNGNRLVSLDPDRPWPLCQDMALDPDEIGAFEVTYYRGSAPTEITRFAAGVLAAEYFKACTGDKKCRLPAGVTTITRGGTTMEVDTGLYKDGYTGIREVDQVIRIFNPNGLKQAPRVLSPGTRNPRRSTWSVV